MSSVLKANGLHTSPNLLSSVPDGALVKADNVVIKHAGVIEPRHGQTLDAGTFGGSSAARANAIAFYGNGKVIQHGTDELASTSNDGASYTAYLGTLQPADSSLLRMKFAAAAKNLYFTTTVGTQYLTSLSAAPRAAGVPRGLEPLVLTESHLGQVGVDGAWFTKDKRVAYRVVFGYKDANDNIKLGSPSGRFELLNPADFTADSVVRASNVVTVTIGTGHNFKVGDYINITGGTGAGATTFGTGSTSGFEVQTVTGTTLTYNETAANDSIATPAQVVTSGTKRPTLHIPLPADITANHFFQVYRTVMSADAATPCDDEMFQIYEAPVTAADVSLIKIVFNDNVPESSLFNQPLYTNPRTGSGILDSNDRPPYAKDMCLWQERMWWANTTQPYRLSTQLLGVGSPDGIQVGDVVTINGAVFTAVTPGTPTGTLNTYEFVICDESLSISRNIRDTAMSLISQINSLNMGYKAYYGSGENDAPGKILFERDSLVWGTFYFGASRSASWNPSAPTAFTVSSGTRTGSTVTITTSAAHGFAAGQVVYLASNAADGNYGDGLKTIVSVPTSTTFTYTSGGTTAPLSGTFYVYAITQAADNSANVHSLYYSKFEQPEAVPITNYLPVGSRNKAILRIVPNGDKLIVFKEDGIFSVSGQPPGLRVDPIDRTTRLLAPDTAVECNNQVFAYTNQGVVGVTEAGVAVLSRPIEDSIIRYTANANTQLYSWGCAHESERMYLLGMASTTTHATEVWCYNILTNAWTRWPIARRFAAVDPYTDKLCLAASDINKLWTERRGYTYTDYSDQRLASVTFTTTDGQSVVLSSASGVEVGDVFYADADNSAGGVITAINGSTVTLHAANGTLAGLATGTGYIVKGIAYEVEWVAAGGGNPNTLKHFREAALHFGSGNAYGGYVTLRTDKATTVSNVGTTLGYTFRSDPTEQINKRVLVPLEKQRGVLMRVGWKLTEAWANWRLHGYSLETDANSQRTER